MLAITRFLASSALEEIAPKLRDLRDEWRQADREYDRLERDLIRAEERGSKVKRQAWDLVERTANGLSGDEDIWSLGDLHPDYWE